MHRLTAALGMLLVVGVMFTAPPPAAAERTQSDFVLVREDEVISEDLYAAGDLIVIAGEIEGDLVASAFTEVRIEGVIHGSVFAVSSKVVIDGVVDGSVRVFGGDVEVNGTVGDDVFAGGWSVTFGPGSDVGRDGLVWGNDVSIDGRVGRNVEGQFRTGAIAARVDGDIDVTVGDLIVAPTTRVVGDLIYVGDGDATISEDAVIAGSVIVESELPPNVRIRALFLLVKLLVGLAVIALGLALIWTFPERSHRAAGAVSERPLQALAWGLGLASIPVAMALVVGVFVSLSPPATGLPLLLVFSPLLVAAFAILLVGLFSAPVPISAAIGRRIGPARSVYAWFLIGAAVLGFIALIPWVGVVVMLVAALAGLGGWFISSPVPANRSVAVG